MADRKDLEITGPKLLLVEGSDEEFLFSALTKHMNLTDVQVVAVRGKGNFERDIGVFAQDQVFRDEVTALGIVTDADLNTEHAFQMVQEALAEAHLAVPDQPLQSAGTNPKVVILVVPHGATNGELEDVCLESVADDPAMPCVDEFFQCIDSYVGGLPNKLSKARVQAFLSSKTP